MNRRHFVIFGIVFTNLLGAGVVVPTLPLFAEDRFGATALEAGAFVALYYVTQFFAAPIMGQWADRFGRKPILVWSQVGTIASFLLFIFAAPLARVFESVGLVFLANGFIILSFARALDGITGGNVTAAQAYISDITADENRAEMLGYIHIAFALGIVFGPAFGGALSQFGFIAPFVGAAVITGISLLATILLLEESLPEEMRLASGETERHTHERAYHKWLKHLSSEVVLMLLGLAFVTHFTIAGLSAVFPLYAERIAFPNLADNLVARNVGFMMAYLGIMAVFGQVFLIRPLIARFGEQTAIVFSIFSAWITCIGLGLISDPIRLTLILTPAAFAYSVGIPAGEALLMRYGDARSAGQLMGMLNATQSLAYIIGPLLGGLLFDWFSPRTPFYFSSALVIVGLGLAFRLRSRTVSSKTFTNL